MHSSYGWKGVRWLSPAAGALTIAVGTTALAPSAARAQAEVASEANAPSEETGLAEIVVTARKRVESMQSIPESITAFGAQEITDAHITKIDDLGNLVSNLNITTRADNTPDVVLRGIGSFGVVSGVGFYANDLQLFDGQRRQQCRWCDQIHYQAADR
jgi:outer membrane receptor protein involved in Fe transport